MLEREEIGAVKDLFVRLVDSKLGYELAAKKAKQPRHQDLFSNLAGIRGGYATIIQMELLANNEDADMDGTASGDIHRFWVKVRDALGGDDEVLLEEILTGEKNLIKQYEDAISSTKSNIELLAALQGQLKEVKSNYELLDIKEEAA